MGNIFRMKVHQSKNLVTTIKKLQISGYQIIGTANENRSKVLSRDLISKKTAIIIGSEGHGMDEEVKDACDQLMKIEVDEQVEHINASAAASIFLYEISAINRS